MIKKFYATTTRDALRQVRDALGANAIILSNRQVGGGVEIIAVADLDMANLTSQAEPAILSHAPRPASPPPPPRAAPVPPRQMTLEEASPQLTAFADYLAQRDASLSGRPQGSTKFDATSTGGGRAPRRGRNCFVPPRHGKRKAAHLPARRRSTQLSAHSTRLSMPRTPRRRSPSPRFMNWRGKSACCADWWKGNSPASPGMT